MNDDILIAGGYGVVGQRIARVLAPGYPGRVVIAGRRLDAAQAMATQIGHGTRAAQLDVEDETSIGRNLERTGVVMSCVDQPRRALLRAAAHREVAYVDLTPHLSELRDYDAVDAAARSSGARLVLGAGISPGITSVMGCAISRQLGGLDEVEVTLLFGLGDEFGPSSSQFIFGTISSPFDITIAGRTRRVRPFTEPSARRLPEPLGRRTTYLFPWSDPVFFPRTLGVRTSIGRFAVDPPWVGALVSGLVRSGLAERLARRRKSNAQKRLLAAIKRRCVGRDAFAVVVRGSRGDRTMSMSVAGRRQADCTAAGAAQVLRMVCDGAAPSAGAWFVEQVIEPEAFFSGLSELGYTVSRST